MMKNENNTTKEKMMTKETTIECYMMNSKEVLAEMLYKTIEKYENLLQEKQKNIDSENVSKKVVYNNRLTDIGVKKLQIKENAYKVFDGNGLYILVSNSGSKLWKLKYYDQGKSRVMSIGRFPDVSVEDARTIAIKEKENIAKTTDAKLTKKSEDTVESKSTIMRVDDVAKYLAMSKSNVWKLTADGIFKNYKLSDRVTVWKKEDLDDYIKNAIK